MKFAACDHSAPASASEARQGIVLTCTTGGAREIHASICTAVTISVHYFTVCFIYGWYNGSLHGTTEKQNRGELADASCSAESIMVFNGRVMT